MKKAHKNPEKRTSTKRVFLAIIVLCIALLAIVSAAFLPPYSAPKEFVRNSTLEYGENILFTYEINRYPTQAEISNVTGENITVGFSIEPWNLNFGIVPTGGNSGKRFLTLENIKDGQARIQFIAYGNISSMIAFGSNNFLLSKDAPKPVEIVLETKNSTSLGNYSGEIDIIVKRPKPQYGFAGRLL